MGALVASLTAPPLKGERYRVTVVKARFFDWTTFWPVIGPQHADREYFEFPKRHYHIDPRFLTNAQEDHVAMNMSAVNLKVRGVWRDRTLEVDRWDRVCAAAQLYPLHQIKGAVRIVTRTCRDSAMPYQYDGHDTLIPLHQAYAGRRCKHARSGWICPHRNAPLGSILPDAQGRITCPLHGLVIDAATGIVLSPEPRP